MRTRQDMLLLLSPAWILFATLALFASDSRGEEISLPPETPLPQLGDLPTDFQPYIETIPETNIRFRMIPIPGGKITLGSPEDEEGREDNEGPQLTVEVGPFWMGQCEVTWTEYDHFSFSYDIKAAKQAIAEGKVVPRTSLDVDADAVTRPTPPYVDMTFGYGHDGYPAICMTQHAANHYCKWLAAKTGKAYRLPTEAEWEHACRAGTTGPYSFGENVETLDEYAWYYDNSNEKPQPVGRKKPNPWGLYDMHGNVAEWCLDKYVDDFHARIQDSGSLKNPLLETDETVWHTARGGSWQDDASFLRSAVRYGASEDWSIQDPQIPKSIWWHTDAHYVGFRVVRPYEPKKE